MEGARGRAYAIDGGIWSYVSVYRRFSTCLFILIAEHRRFPVKLRIRGARGDSMKDQPAMLLMLSLQPFTRAYIVRLQSVECIRSPEEDTADHLRCG
ncbi:hypothetical protein Tco_1392671 [Tanacetum coccineum]